MNGCVVMLSIFVALTATGTGEKIQVQNTNVGSNGVALTMATCAAERAAKIEHLRATEAGKYRSYQILCVELH